MDCIPVIQLLLAVFGQFRLFEGIFGKKGQIAGRPLNDDFFNARTRRRKAPVCLRDSLGEKGGIFDHVSRMTRMEGTDGRTRIGTKEKGQRGN